MKLERCKNGHMYDISRYTDGCPYCKAEGLETNIKSQSINLMEQVETDDRTVAYWAKDAETDPVVGWLVCIEGIEKGKDYRIVSERNFIGRGEDMNICIQGDLTISRKNHCSISYNPKSRTFVISPGEATGLVYVNNEAVYESRRLESFDYIEIGESRFVFMALCGSNFDWKLEKTKFDRKNKMQNQMERVPDFEE